MKKIVLLVLLIGISIAWGQIGEWLEDGIPVRQGVNIEWFRSAIEIPGGGCVYTWSDTRLGDRDVFSQRVDVDGNIMWGEEGILINGEIDRQEDIVVINGSEDETIYAWVDFRNEIAGDIYAQKLDGDGNIMWAADGVPLCLAEDIQISLNIVSDGSGGAYIIWLDERNPAGTDIYGTHILTDGSIATGWDVDGNAIAAEQGAQKQHTFWEDGEGGAVVVWHDERAANNHDLYMQRMSANNPQEWALNGNLLCGAEGIQEKAKISPDGTGGFIVAWRDYRNGLGGDVFANRIDMEGNVVWAEDLAVYVGTGNQRNVRLAECSEGGSLVVWEDDRINGDYFDLYVQKINLDGTIDWDAEGVSVCSSPLHQFNPRITGDDDGGCWIIWDDGRDGDHPNENIYIQHFDTDGNIELEADGRLVSNAPGEQFSPLIKRDDTGQIFLIWGDNETGSTAIMHQLIDESGNVLLEENGAEIYYGLCGDGTDYRMLGRENGHLMFWIDTRKSVTANQIYMQILNEDGSFGLVEDGEPITVMPEMDHDQGNMRCALMGEDAIVVWEELENDMLQLFAQKIGDDMDYQWGDSGMELSTRESNHFDSQLSIVGDAVYVAWCDQDSDFMNPTYQVCAQKIVDGVLQWDEEGIVVGETPGDDDVLKEVVETYFIWEVQRTQNYDLYINHLTEDGEIATGWQENGIALSTAVANQQNPQAVMTEEGLLVIWEDLRSGMGKDIYGQLVSETGEFSWEADGRALITADLDQQNYELQYHNGEIYLIWEDMRNGDNYDIYMQKYDLAGNELWTAGGVEAVIKPNQQSNPTFSFGDNSFLIYWDDVEDENDIDLFAKMYDYDGNLVVGWPEEGSVVCSAIKSQQTPVAVAGEDNYSYVIWSDFRSSGKTDIYNIYAQKISLGDSAKEISELEDLVNLNLNNYPNPFRGGTVLSFDLLRDQEAEGVVEIFNVKGQKVRSLNTIGNSVHWDGRDNAGKLSASGIYMYQYHNSAISSEVSKMILVR